MRAKVVTGNVYVTAAHPTRKGGQWVITQGQVGGSTPVEAVEFAAALVASLMEHRAIEAARPRETVQPEHCANHDGTSRDCVFGASRTNVHTGKCAQGGAVTSSRESREAIARLVVAFNSKRPTRAQAQAPAKRVRRARPCEHCGHVAA